MSLPRTPSKNLLKQRQGALLAAALIFAVSNVVSIETVTAAPPHKVFVFSGKIRAVDAASRTFTLEANTRTYVFSVIDETKIVRDGVAQRFADLKEGQDAEVDMKIGSGGKG